MEPKNAVADPLLFTPGPLTTSLSVKEAMLHDLGSRDEEFIRLVRNIRNRLLTIAGVDAPEYECILIQGSGTYAIEAVVSSALLPSEKLLVLVNGAYGRRIRQIADVHRIQTESLVSTTDRPIQSEDVEMVLAHNPSISHVAVVHCETTTGLLNPIEAIGAVVRRMGRTYIVDAMSSFGGVPIDVKAAAIDFLVSSANKCIEGVPGFSFVIAGHEALARTKGRARTVALDLFAQWLGLESDGQFRFTPPTHALLAFSKALDEFDAENGVVGRSVRYRANRDELDAGMRALGFREYLPVEQQSHIITTFYYPEQAGFAFEEFYRLLRLRGFVIYPGKLIDAQCFRIGTIGRIDRRDVAALVSAIEQVLGEMKL